MKKPNFGIGQIVNETPLWALWMFRVTLIITTAAAGYLAATNLLPEQTKYEATLILKFVDVIVFGLSKCFGVEVKKEGDL